MKLEHEFSVPVPIAQAWDVLLDVERIAPCMPGATVDAFDGETVEGRVKVKVGPIQVAYAGTAKFVDKDEAARQVTLDASGKESRGSGTAKATIVAALHDEGSSSRVTVTTDLAITGKPAQFGRGVMAEVGNKLLGRFADCLAETISASGPASTAMPADRTDGTASNATSAAPASTPAEPAAGTTTSQSSAPIATAPRPAVPEQADAIDLLDVGGAAIAKRVAPAALGALVLFVLWRALRRD